MKNENSIDISQCKLLNKNIIPSLIKFRFKIYFILLLLLFYLSIKNINKNQYHEDPPMSISFKNMYKNNSLSYDIEQSNNFNIIH